MRHARRCADDATCRASRGRIGRERADEVVKAARPSAGASSGARHFVFGLMALIECMEYFKQQIAKLEDKVARALSKTAGGARRVCCAVGPAPAAPVSGETYDANCLETPSKFVAHTDMSAADTSRV